MGLINTNIAQKYEDACWVAQALFVRGRVSGSSANISFVHDRKIYISGSGTCFGRLTPTDFAVTDWDGIPLSAVKPSKELELHRTIYRHCADVEAVIHTHAPYTTLWSCLPHEKTSTMPQYTPYLRMRVGTVGLIPYAAPGTQELFELFRARIGADSAYILQNHGGIVGGKSLLDAFYSIEELEDSARIAWYMRNENVRPDL